MRHQKLIGAVLAAALAAALSGAAPAVAQQMPDPRQMSGMPRADVQVKVGSATVRVIHGDLAKNAAEGTPVHLVAMYADGRVELRTVPLDKNGRATFDKLATDGSVAYYAYALVGEDRLESQMLTLDKMAGYRLMLVARKLDGQGQPVGTPVDDAASGENEAVPSAGEVWVALGGRGIGDKTEVELVEVPAEGGSEKLVAKVAATPVGEGRFVARFSGVGHEGKVLVARATVGGRRYFAKPFMAKAGAGVGRSILVIDQIIITAHIAAELDDDKLRFQTQYTLGNYGGGPWDPGKEGLVLPLPAGSLGGQLAGESSLVKVDPGKKVIWKGVLPPGESEIIVAYALPVEDGVASFTMPVPFGLFQSTVVMEQAPGSTLTPPAGVPFDVRETPEGRKFFVAQPINLPAGGTLSFKVAGLPRPSQLEAAARLGVGVLVAFLILGAVAFVLWGPMPGRKKPAGSGARAAGEAGARRKELAARREALYDELVALERRRAERDIDDDDYQQNRQAVVSRLTLVLRELDQLDGGGARG